MPSSIRKCKICGEMERMESTICPACEEKVRDDFAKVREYLSHHPQANAAQIANDVEAEHSHVLYMIDNKWLTSERPPERNEPRCSLCGRPLTSAESGGRMCKQCMTLTQQKLENVRKSIVSSNPDLPVRESPQERTQERSRSSTEGSRSMHRHSSRDKD